MNIPGLTRNVNTTIVFVKNPNTSRFISSEDEKDFHKVIEKEDHKISEYVPQKWIKNPYVIDSVHDVNPFTITTSILKIQRYIHNEMSITYKDLLDMEIVFCESVLHEESNEIHETGNSSLHLHRYPPYGRTSIDHNSHLIDTMVDAEVSRPGILNPYHMIIYVLLRNSHSPYQGFSELVERYLLIENQHTARAAHESPFQADPLSSIFSSLGSFRSSGGQSTTLSGIAPPMSSGSSLGVGVTGPSGFQSFLFGNPLVSVSDSYGSSNQSNSNPPVNNTLSPGLLTIINSEEKDREQILNSLREDLEDEDVSEEEMPELEDINENLREELIRINEVERNAQLREASNRLVPQRLNLYRNLLQSNQNRPERRGGINLGDVQVGISQVEPAIHLPDGVRQYVINDPGSGEMFEDNPRLNQLYDRMMGNLLGMFQMVNQDGRRLNLTDLMEPVRVTVDDKNMTEFVEYFQYKDIETKSDKIKSQDTCPICLDTFEKEDNVACIRTCEHVFHELCVKKWLQEFNHRCPVCRTSADPSKNEK